MNPVTLRYVVAGVGALVLIAVPFGLTAYGNYVLSLWALTTKGRAAAHCMRRR